MTIYIITVAAVSERKDGESRINEHYSTNGKCYIQVTGNGNGRHTGSDRK